MPKPEVSHVRGATCVYQPRCDPRGAGLPSATSIATIHIPDMSGLPEPQQHVPRRTAGLASMLPVYEALMELDPAPRILVFSGDVDGCVPHLGTRRWVSSLGLRPVRPWRSWHSSTGARALILVDHTALSSCLFRSRALFPPIRAQSARTDACWPARRGIQIRRYLSCRTPCQSRSSEERSSTGCPPLDNLSRHRIPTGSKCWPLYVLSTLMHSGVMPLCTPRLVAVGQLAFAWPRSTGCIVADVRLACALQANWRASWSSSAA